MGKRKIFTKREYEKLSKTHEGRQHINATYLKCSIFGIVSFIFLLIGSCYLTNLLGAMEEDVPIIILLFAISGIGLLFCIGLAINYSLAYKRENEDEARRKEIEEIRIQHLKNSRISEIDAMGGFEFEEFISLILSDLGYDVKPTRKSGDFGADLILEKNGERIIVQTKRYSQKVSVSAIQEITAAQNFYGIYRACVITNNYFTAPAIKLANANNIKLIDRDELSKMIIEAKELHIQRVHGNFPDYLVGRDR